MDRSTASVSAPIALPDYRRLAHDRRVMAPGPVVTRHRVHLTAVCSSVNPSAISPACQ
jgi:hypothetical protein